MRVRYLPWGPSDGHRDGTRAIQYLGGRGQNPAILTPNKTSFSTHPAYEWKPSGSLIISSDRRTWKSWKGGILISFWISGKDLMKIENEWEDFDKATEVIVLVWGNTDLAIMSWLYKVNADPIRHWQ